MSISLHVQVSDPELEKLLAYLNTLEQLPLASKQELLERALDMVRKIDPFLYRTTETPTVTLEIDGIRVLSALPARTPVPHGPEKDGTFLETK